MLEFIISNYIILIVAAIVLLLGLFGYMMDKKKYKQYREEIVNEQRALETLEYQPDIQNVATPVLLDNDATVQEQPQSQVQPQVQPQVQVQEPVQVEQPEESVPAEQTETEVPVVPEVQQN